MYICTYVRTYELVCMYMYVFMHACTYVRMNICMHVCVYVRMYIRIVWERVVSSSPKNAGYYRSIFVKGNTTGAQLPVHVHRIPSLKMRAATPQFPIRLHGMVLKELQEQM
jgi:hypothetical protein